MAWSDAARKAAADARRLRSTEMGKLYLEVKRRSKKVLPPLGSRVKHSGMKSSSHVLVGVMKHDVTRGVTRYVEGGRHYEASISLKRLKRLKG